MTNDSSNTPPWGMFGGEEVERSQPAPKPTFDEAACRKAFEQVYNWNGLYGRKSKFFGDYVHFFINQQGEYDYPAVQEVWLIFTAGWKAAMGVGDG